MVDGFILQTIQLIRMCDCSHYHWVKINDQEEQCTGCAVIATEEGKRNLKRFVIKK